MYSGPAPYGMGQLPGGGGGFNPNMLFRPGMPPPPGMQGGQFSFSFPSQHFMMHHPVSAPYPSLSEEQLYTIYCQYGVDLVRTAGRIVKLSPAVIYYASVLLQRFQSVAQSRYRSQYTKNSQFYTLNAAHRSTKDGRGRHLVDYIPPAHASVAMGSGMLPLADLLAPLDYCVHTLVSGNDDLLFLAAACLFLSSKLIDRVGMDPLRQIVETFIRISCSRASTIRGGESLYSRATGTLRFDNYRTCVVLAEEVVTRVLGFHIGFTESPYKYLLCYLHFLVDDEEEGAADPTTLKMSATRRRYSPAYQQWLYQATALINDVPRSQEMLHFSPSALAVYAIHTTAPTSENRVGSITQETLELPKGWTRAFGVSEEELNKMMAAAAKVKQQYRDSKSIIPLIQQLGKPDYGVKKSEVKAPTPPPTPPPPATNPSNQPAASMEAHLASLAEAAGVVSPSVRESYDPRKGDVVTQGGGAVSAKKEEGLRNPKNLNEDEEEGEEDDLLALVRKRKEQRKAERKAEAAAHSKEGPSSSSKNSKSKEKSSAPEREKGKEREREKEKEKRSSHDSRRHDNDGRRKVASSSSGGDHRSSRRRSRSREDSRDRRRKYSPRRDSHVTRGGRNTDRDESHRHAGDHDSKTRRYDLNRKRHGEKR